MAVQEEANQGIRFKLKLESSMKIMYCYSDEPSKVGVQEEVNQAIRWKLKLESSMKRMYC